MFEGHKVVAVVAIGKNRELGNQNKLLWHIPDDLKRFRSLTLGHPIIMGRKTFESIFEYLKRPLPDRTNIVVTRGKSWTCDGVIVARSFEDALAKAKEAPGSDEIHIGGGAEIYGQALPYIDLLRLTIVDSTPAAADAHFPEYEKEFTVRLHEETREHEGISYTWIDLQRA